MSRRTHFCAARDFLRVPCSQQDAMLSSSAGCLEVACLGGSLCLPQRESEAIAQKYGVGLVGPRNIAVFWASLLTSPLEAPRAAAKSVRRGQRSPGPPEVDWDTKGRSKRAAQVADFGTFTNRFMAWSKCDETPSKPAWQLKLSVRSSTCCLAEGVLVCRCRPSETML